ncbi:MAG TPA: hypothetical protein VK419_12890, partial [Bryobacteraceae bacterium]|nr:hypothetical protein [Bryobacteraceae bacterium]
DRSFPPYETLECELIIAGGEPGQLTEQTIVLRCRAKVVRVVPQADRTAFGIACKLSDYTIGPEISEQNLVMEFAT